MLDITYPPIIASGYGLFKVLNLKFATEGLDYLPREGGAVLASNHVSYFDFIFCGFAARPSGRLVRFMAKKATFDNPVSGVMMRSMHHIPVDRTAGSGALAQAIESLQKGEVVGVFPEATISQSFELKDFKSGAVRMASAAGVPIVPMITFGGQRLWSKGHKREMERGSTVSLTLGEPMEVPAKVDTEAATAELKARMQGLYETTLADYPDKPADGTWWWPARFGGGAPTLAERREIELRDQAKREGRDYEAGEQGEQE